MTELEEIIKEYADNAPWRAEIENDLPVFLARHKAAILKFRDRKIKTSRKEISTNDATCIAVKFYVIAATRSINSATENLAQLRQARVAKWLWNEKLTRVLSWDEVWDRFASECAQGWRYHRLLQIVYVFERDREKLLPLLIE